MHKEIHQILAALMEERRINQSELSKRTGVGQSTISRILKPNGPKGIKVPKEQQVKPLADFFGITVGQIRGYEPFPSDKKKTLSDDLRAECVAANAQGLPAEQRAKSIQERSAIAAALASPKSRQTLDNIVQAAEDGLLTDEDVELLEMMVQRIMARTSVPTTADPLDGSNTRLRNRLRNAPTDSDTQR